MGLLADHDSESTPFWLILARGSHGCENSGFSKCHVVGKSAECRWEIWIMGTWQCVRCNCTKTH